MIQQNFKENVKYDYTVVSITIENINFNRKSTINLKKEKFKKETQRIN